MNGLAKLEKLNIIAYSKVGRNRSQRIGKVVVMFNPESVRQSYNSQYRSKQSINSTGKQAIYMFNPPAELELTLVIDGSNAAAKSAGGVGNPMPAKPADVMKKVKDFRKLAYEMNGKIHQPNFMKLAWGSMDYNCRLRSFTVTYLNYNNSGKPMRAEIQARFIHEEPADKRKTLERKSSADLTHKRIVKQGDTLPMMARAIYGNPALYIQLARYNGLDDFRNLQAGQEIVFPPVAKDEEL